MDCSKFTSFCRQSDLNLQEIPTWLGSYEDLRVREFMLVLCFEKLEGAWETAVGIGPGQGGQGKFPEEVTPG